MIFIDNKYTQWYYSIIANALSRSMLADYTENHHIIPKSLGGDNSLDNLVRLTPKEHFVCHRLLTKMVFNAAAKIKMHNAAFQKTVTSSNQQRYKISSRSYALLKRNKSIAMKGNTYGSNPMSAETKRKISNAKKGVSVNKGKLISVEQKEKLSIALKGRIPWNKGKTYSHKK